ncbi:MAG: MlaD family protein [Gammaproteobacteria bacterium]|nr:MlaD family protein [Gammaproteobacteria bacterium]MDH4310594.1 MlaD family protein [Gammaproteobacteria bacterium]MDH5272632.1 MlaD family protein [Gammaproteobacteria bacterium]
MERDAKYATLALFALACVAAAVAFIWWYSGRGDQRDYQTYEIYFQGTVSGLSKGSPVRYLGVDVGRVTRLGVDKADPRQVRVVAEIDSSAPISGRTLAKLGLLGLTGLLYIDLQQNPDASGERPLQQGTQHPVIPSRKSSIEASIERLPEILGQATEVLSRIALVLSDENVRSVGQTLAHVEKAAGDLPETMAEARALATELRGISSSTLELTNRLNRTLGKVQPDLEATLANARIASDKLARTADGLDHLLNENDGGLGKTAGASVAELQQLLIDARSASNEVRELARTLRERPSSVLFEPQTAGVEIAR